MKADGTGQRVIDGRDVVLIEKIDRHARSEQSPHTLERTATTNQRLVRPMKAL